MDNVNKIKENIKKDLLKNIDKVVNGIYESLNNPSFTSNLEDTEFILEGNPYKEMSISDKLTGKVPCFFPNKNEDNYIEISLDGISKKIKMSNQIFSHLYNFSYKKSMLLKDIPVEILNILEVFEIHQGFQKSKDPNLRSTSKWLLGITLLGNMRYQNKSNAPYVTGKEAKEIVKGIAKNLKNIYNVINGNCDMVDEEDIGITLFNHKVNYKKVEIIEK